MSTLIPFSYSGREVRTVIRDGEPWFVGRDVCSILDIVDARASLNLLDEDERDSVPVTDSMGREQDTIVINEPGLYSLILRSRKPEAKKFKRWVTHEVLPAIRKTGKYAVPAVTAPVDVSSIGRRELAAMVIAEADRADAAEAKVAALAPAAASWEQLAEASGDYSLRDAAHILDRDPSIKTGQNRLAAHLRAIGWCSQDGRPYQRHVEAGRLVARSVTYEHPHTGEPTSTTQLRITPKGLGELHRLMGGSAPLADRQLSLVPA